MAKTKTSTTGYSIDHKGQVRAINSVVTTESKRIRTPAEKGFNIFSIVVFFLLTVLLVRVLVFVTNGSDINDFTGVPTFSGLLEFFTTIEPPTIPFLTYTSTQLGDWGAFNFLREVVVALQSIVNVLSFVFNGLFTLVTYVVIFFQWLFL